MISETELKELEIASNQFPSTWVEWNEIKNEAGVPIELDGDHYFLRVIYDDLSPLQVLLKPPQIGATIMNTLKSFYVAKMKGKQIIYTLPTQGDVSDMVGGSINRVIAQNPILMEWVKDHDTVEQKTVGNSIIFYRGTFTAKQAMMIPSDLNIHDEVDVSDAQVITQYETRLQAKANGWRWYFSHPSLSDHGVDIYWRQSDKKEWFITCPCGYEQVLTWPSSIDPIRGVYICTKCKAELSNDNRKHGVWKPTSQGVFSGYHISQLMCPWISASKILEARNDPMKDEQYFYNYVLGLPYVESNDKISPEAVLKNVIPTVNTQSQPIVIGVDTGLPIYFTCMNKEGVFYAGTCGQTDPYSELERLLMRWPQAVLVSDQGGDLIGIRQLQQKYPGRVFLCYYRKDRKTGETTKWQDDGSVVVDRNKMIQLIVEQMRDVGRIPLNGKEEDWKVFASHFGNIMRVKKETPFGMEYAWERNGPDHFVHALLYAMVGFDRFGMQESGVVSGRDWLDDVPIARNFDV